MLNHSKSYEELIGIDGFQDRLLYLLLHGSVAKETFGYERYLNQLLYKCPEWRSVRNKIILRDNGCDLACDGYDIYKGAIVHHINPITIENVLHRDSIVFDPNNLITTKLDTHNLIHYGSENDIINLVLTERSPNDTCLWRR